MSRVNFCLGNHFKRRYSYILVLVHVATLHITHCTSHCTSHCTPHCTTHHTAHHTTAPYILHRTPHHTVHHTAHHTAYPTTLHTTTHCTLQHTAHQTKSSIVHRPPVSGNLAAQGSSLHSPVEISPKSTLYFILFDILHSVVHFVIFVVFRDLTPLSTRDSLWYSTLQYVPCINLSSSVLSSLY